MIKNLLVFLLVLLNTVYCYSKNQKDSIDQLYQDVTIGQTKPADVESTINKVSDILSQDTLKPEDRLKAMLVYANLHKLKSDNKKALEIAQSASQYAKKEDLHLWNARFLGYISSIYRVHKMLDLSQQTLKQGIEAAKKAPDSQEKSKFYGNALHEMAYYSSLNKHYQESIDYLKQSNVAFEDLSPENRNFQQAINYQYMGDVFNNFQQSDSAIYYLNKSLALVQHSEDINKKTLENYALTSLGESFLNQKDLKSAKNALLQVAQDSGQYKNLVLNQRLYKNLITYYELEKNIDSLGIYKHQLDSVNNLLFQSELDAINAVTTTLTTQVNETKNKRVPMYWALLPLGLMVGVWFKHKKKLRNKNKKTQRVNSLETTLETPLVKPSVKQEEIKIAKETQNRLLAQIKVFEQNKQFLDKNISTSTMALELNTNARYITYILHKAYQQDFNTYINTLRINYITNLLDTQEEYRKYKISYLGDLSGFSSHSKFAEIFKKIKGCTPSKYIQDLNQKSQ